MSLSIEKEKKKMKLKYLISKLYINSNYSSRELEIILEIPDQTIRKAIDFILKDENTKAILDSVEEFQNNQEVLKSFRVLLRNQIKEKRIQNKYKAYVKPDDASEEQLIEQLIMQIKQLYGETNLAITDEVKEDIVRMHIEQKSIGKICKIIEEKTGITISKSTVHGIIKKYDEEQGKQR